MASGKRIFCMGGGQVCVAAMSPETVRAAEHTAGAVLRFVQATPGLARVLGTAYSHLHPELRLATTRGETLLAEASVWEHPGDLVVYNTAFARFVTVRSALGGEVLFDGPVDKRKVRSFEELDFFLRRVLSPASADPYSFVRYCALPQASGRLPTAEAGRKTEIYVEAALGRSPSRKTCAALAARLWSSPAEAAPALLEPYQGSVAAMATNGAGRDLLWNAVAGCCPQALSRLGWILDELGAACGGQWLRLTAKPYYCERLLRMLGNTLPPAVLRAYRIPRLST